MSKSRDLVSFCAEGYPYQKPSPAKWNVPWTLSKAESKPKSAGLELQFFPSFKLWYHREWKYGSAITREIIPGSRTRFCWEIFRLNSRPGRNRSEGNIFMRSELYLAYVIFFCKYSNYHNCGFIYKQNSITFIHVCRIKKKKKTNQTFKYISLFFKQLLEKEQSKPSFLLEDNNVQCKYCQI